MYSVLNERDECTGYDSQTFYAVAPGLSAQRGLGTTNKQITSSRDMNAEIGGCPMRAATRFKQTSPSPFHLIPLPPPHLKQLAIYQFKLYVFTAPFNKKRTPKFKAQPANAFLATVNQMFAGFSELPTTAESAIIESLSTVKTTKQ